MKPLIFENYALIFCNGVPPDAARLRKLIPMPGPILCADGGADKAASLGYTPDYIVGDLDSVDRTAGYFKTAQILQVDSQENTDFEKTLDFALAQQLTRLMVAGFSGGRIDQTIANLQIAYKYSRKCTIMLVDDSYLVFPVTRLFECELPIGTSLSILSMEENTEVTTTGLKYELVNESLPLGGRGISNISTRETVRISIASGGALLFIQS